MSMQQVCTKNLLDNYKYHAPLFASTCIFPVDMLYFETFHPSCMMSITILHTRIFRNSHLLSRVHKPNTRFSAIGNFYLSELRLQVENLYHHYITLTKPQHTKNN